MAGPDFDGTKPVASSAMVSAEMRTNFNALRRRLTTNTTPVGNVDTGTDDLMSYSVPANTLSANGQALQILACGYFAANTNNKLINFVFGATTLALLGSSAYNGVRWRADVEVVRTGAATQLLTGVIEVGGSILGFGGGGAWPTPAETLSGAVTAKFQGSGTASDDIVQSVMIVELLA